MTRSSKATPSWPDWRQILVQFEHAVGRAEIGVGEPDEDAVAGRELAHERLDLVAVAQLVDVAADGDALLRLHRLAERLHGIARARARTCWRRRRTSSRPPPAERRMRARRRGLRRHALGQPGPARARSTGRRRDVLRDLRLQAEPRLLALDDLHQRREELARGALLGASTRRPAAASSVSLSTTPQLRYRVS